MEILWNNSVKKNDPVDNFKLPMIFSSDSTGLKSGFLWKCGNLFKKTENRRL
jgi:hypothetical protein